MNGMLRRLALASVLVGVAAAQAPNTLTPQEQKEGWILLFDGKSLNGWEQHGGAKWSVQDGTIVPEGKGGWLGTTRSFTDLILRVEFKTTADCNGGVFIRSDPKSEKPPQATGYEIQIADTHRLGFTTGSFVDHIKTSEEAKIVPDQWNTFEITARGNQFTVVYNGKKVLEGSDDKARSGVVGLQHNRVPTAFRNIRVKPL